MKNIKFGLLAITILLAIGLIISACSTDSSSGGGGDDGGRRQPGPSGEIASGVIPGGNPDGGDQVKTGLAFTAEAEASTAPASTTQINIVIASPGKAGLAAGDFAIQDGTGAATITGAINEVDDKNYKLTITKVAGGTVTVKCTDADIAGTATAATTLKGPAKFSAAAISRAPAAVDLDPEDSGTCVTLTLTTTPAATAIEWFYHTSDTGDGTTTGETGSPVSIGGDAGDDLAPANITQKTAAAWGTASQGDDETVYMYCEITNDSDGTDTYTNAWVETTDRVALKFVKQ